METIVRSFKSNKITYIVETPLRRQEIGKMLMRYFLGEVVTRLNTIDLDAQSKGKRTVSKIDDYVIKQSNTAFIEFKKTLQIETITDITPLVGGVLREEGKNDGFIALQFFSGVPPINFNPFTMKSYHRERVVKAILFAMGKLHIGNGKEVILHRDAHLGNFIIIPNPGEDEILFRTEKRLEVRVIDLEKALITNFSRKVIGEMAFDLLITLNQLMYHGYLTPNELTTVIDSYLEANIRLDKKELINALKQEIPKHKKLKKAAQLQYFLP